MNIQSRRANYANERELVIFFLSCTALGEKYRARVVFRRSFRGKSEQMMRVRSGARLESESHMFFICPKNMFLFVFRSFFFILNYLMGLSFYFFSTLFTSSARFIAGRRQCGRSMRRILCRFVRNFVIGSGRLKGCH